MQQRRLDRAAGQDPGRVRPRLRDRTLRLVGGQHGHAGVAHQLPERRLGATDADAGEHHRAARAGERHRRRLGCGWRRDRRLRRPAGVEQHRPPGRRQRARHAVGGIGDRALRGRCHQRGVVEPLVRVGEAGAVRHDHHRLAVEVGLGDPVHGRGEARTAGAQRQPRLLGQLPPGAGCDHRGGLAVREHEPDPVPPTGAGQIEVRATAGNAEADLRPGGRERRGDAVGVAQARSSAPLSARNAATSSSPRSGPH